MNKKKILIICGIIISILIIGLIVFLCVRPKKVSNLEEMKLRESSSEIVSYIYNVTNDEYEEVEKYILYSLDYYKYNKGVNSVEIDEVVSLIKDVFNIEYSEEDILAIGMTLEMVNRNITFDFQRKTFNITDVAITKSVIAETPLTFYKVDKIRKKGDKYFVDYIEYTIDNPYEILNYYNNLTEEFRNYSSVEGEDGEMINVDALVDSFDTSDILAYLNGEKSKKVLYNFINDDLLDKVGNVSNKVNITYILDNDKIIIDKVETE